MIANCLLIKLDFDRNGKEQLRNADQIVTV